MVIPVLGSVSLIKVGSALVVRYITGNAARGTYDSEQTKGKQSMKKIRMNYI